MSEPTSPPDPAPGTPAPGAPAPPAPARRSSWKYTLAAVAVLVAAAAGYYLYARAQTPEPPPVDESGELKAYLARFSANQKLDAAYADADPKDLVADTPKDPAK